MTVAVLVLDAVGVLLLVHAVVNAILLRRLPPRAQVDERVSILMPMRDEAHRLTSPLTSVLAQRGLADCDVLVYDDDSSDGTADLVRTVGGAGVALVPAEPLPAGWLGKPHACAVLAAHATGTALVFVDADVVLAPYAVAGAVSLMRSRRLGFVSPYPRQRAASWLEHLVQPLLTWSWLTLLPLRVSERSRRPSLVAANGQLLVVDAAAYRAAGGHASVHDQVVDDVALARALRASGARGGFVDGHDVAGCRMYDGPRALVDGYAKSLFTAFGSPAGGVAVTLSLLVVFVLPWALVPFTALAWVGAGAGVGTRVVSAVRTGDNIAAAVLHPLSILAYAALFTVSVVRHRRGSLTWKARRVG